MTEISNGASVCFNQQPLVGWPREMHPAHLLKVWRWSRWQDEDYSRYVHSTASDCGHRALRGHMIVTMDKDQERGTQDLERKKDWDADWEINQDIMGLLRPQTQMLQRITDLHAQGPQTQQPFQSLENSIVDPPYAPQYPHPTTPYQGRRRTRATRTNWWKPQAGACVAPATPL